MYGFGSTSNTLLWTLTATAVNRTYSFIHSFFSFFLSSQSSNINTKLPANLLVLQRSSQTLQTLTLTHPNGHFHFISQHNVGLVHMTGVTNRTGPLGISDLTTSKTMLATGRCLCKTSSCNVFFTHQYLSLYLYHCYCPCSWTNSLLLPP